ncbi:MAG: hypothetical protein U0Q22_18875 [Acidimicrobiales bacterium]
MRLDPTTVKQDLVDVGIAPSTVEALWPSWWTPEAASSRSAQVELRFTMARRLGLQPSSLLSDEPQFVWPEDARFKNLGTTTAGEQAALSAYGSAVGHALLPFGSPPSRIVGVAARELRDAILADRPFVTLEDLVTTCWAIGIPLIRLSVFPLRQKRMHAMSVRSGESYAILLGRSTSFASQAAYDIAHELGHIASGHLEDSPALLDVGDPLEIAERDDEEVAADRFALALLTGREEPIIRVNDPNFNSTMLKTVAEQVAPAERIAPGVLCLCAGHATGRWKQVVGALKLLPGEAINTAEYINGVAESQLAHSQVLEHDDYVRAVMGAL